MEIINKTPHAVVVIGDDGVIARTIPASQDGPARLKAEIVSVGDVSGIPLTRTVFGEPAGLPDQVSGRLIIVSQLIKSALPCRNDLVVPAGVVRDADGNIVGCKSLGV